jgi:hypothetical protein
MTVTNPSRRGDPSMWDLMPMQAAWVRDLRPAVPCRAHSSRSGKPCGNFAIKGGAVCPMHGGSAPQVKRAAERRLAGAATEALGARAAARLGIWTPAASRAWLAMARRTLGMTP